MIANETKTRGRGIKTQEVKGVSRTINRLSRTAVQNQDPQFDYCFCRKADVEANGGMYMGYEEVGPENNSGEIPWTPPGVNSKRNHTRIMLDDTVLCRRPKETTAFYNEIWLEKASANFELVRQSAKNAGSELAKLDPRSIVSQKVNMPDSQFSQMAGLTEE